MLLYAVGWFGTFTIVAGCPATTAVRFVTS
jgi:hypothetical protein